MSNFLNGIEAVETSSSRKSRQLKKEDKDRPPYRRKSCCCFLCGKLSSLEEKTAHLTMKPLKDPKKRTRRHSVKKAHESFSHDAFTNSINTDKRENQQSIILKKS